MAMDWKLAATAFVTVLLAELGDKTQLATFGLAAQPGGRLAVFAGAATALVLTSLVAVVFADVVARAVSPLWIKRASGVLFLTIGALTIYGARSGERALPAPSPGAEGSQGADGRPD